MSAPLTPNSGENRILAALPVNERARLMGDLELVSLPPGQVLYEPGAVLAYVYFPTSCIVSLVFTTQLGATVELAMTGKDGLVGIPLVLGGSTSVHKAVVRCAGTTWRLRAEVMAWELKQHGHLLRLALRYTQALMTQMAQSVVCNRHHAVDQRLCRWLLLSLDQCTDNGLPLTQELIANMLGVRREAVSAAAGKLQAAGLIQYRRGQITITDRPGLEARACECYRIVRGEDARLFEFPAMVPPRARANLAHDHADALHRKYAELYDFAPIPYFTLDAQGVIIELNLAAAILIGVQRSQGRPHRFDAFVRPDLRPAFEFFLKEKLRGKCRRSGEFVLLATPHHPERRVRLQAAADKGGQECRLAVIDITPDTRSLPDRRRHPDLKRRRVNDQPAQAPMR